MTTAASTARPPRAAIAWATKDAIFVEIPCKDGPPFIVREHRTAEGLARALNILIENQDHTSAQAATRAHPKVRVVGKAVAVTEAERTEVRGILRKLGIV